MWRRQFESLRDGDRFFYLNDPALREIRSRYGISYRHTLAELIRLNTRELPPEQLAAARVAAAVASLDDLVAQALEPIA